MSFPDLPPPLAEALAEHGYTDLTPVQSAVLQPEAAGRDLIVSAQTGSGKTVAFGLAMASELLGDDGRAAPAARPLALVIAPTRELALQVSRELAWLYRGAGARVATCVGGMDPSKERRSLAGGVPIVVGTPGRLRDHLERGALDLSALRAVVLDEADEMLDMGFRDELEEILHAALQERGFAVVALSGEHSQQERNQAMQALRDRRARVCVATDVAARGIDLPSVSLVVHVEIPRDAEALQDRSGRTGRAGKKGTAAIIVPYPRRRRVEAMLRGARIDAEWIEAPTREMITAQDRERLLAKLLAPVEFDEEDRELAQRLLAERSAEDIAAALVHAHRAAMPQPEELVANTPEARQAAKQERHRPGFDDTVWFRLAVGRRQNADPKWILPVLCPRGHVSRGEIGAIRIGPDETFVQIPRAVAGKFADALVRTAAAEAEAGEEVLAIEPSNTG